MSGQVVIELRGLSTRFGDTWVLRVSTWRWKQAR